MVKGRKANRQTSLLNAQFPVTSNPFIAFPFAEAFTYIFCENRRHLMNYKWKIWLINHPVNTFIMRESPGRPTERYVKGVDSVDTVRLEGHQMNMRLLTEIGRNIRFMVF
jgi:hypothetical protein